MNSTPWFLLIGVGSVVSAAAAGPALARPTPATAAQPVLSGPIFEAAERRGRGAWGLYKLKPEQGYLQSLQPWRYQAAMPQRSPDGKRLLYTRALEHKACRLEVFPAFSWDEEIVSVVDYGLNWPPVAAWNGPRRVVYWDESSHTIQLRGDRLPTQDSVRLDAVLSVLSIVSAPDGAFLVWTRARRIPDLGYRDTAITVWDTERAQRLLSVKPADNQDALNPRWCGSQRKLSFEIVDTSLGTRIPYVLDIDSRRRSLLPLPSAEDGESVRWAKVLEWDPKGEQALVLCRRPTKQTGTVVNDFCDRHLLVVNTREPVAFLKPPSTGGTEWDAVWSPDGQRICYITSTYPQPRTAVAADIVIWTPGGMHATVYSSLVADREAIPSVVEW